MFLRHVQYGVFNNTVSSLGCVAPSENNDLGYSRKSWIYVKYYASICLEGLWKTIKDLSLNIWSLGRDLNLFMSFAKALVWNCMKIMERAMKNVSLDCSSFTSLLFSFGFYKLVPRAFWGGGLWCDYHGW
jgi:hypothetical protein